MKVKYNFGVKFDFFCFGGGQTLVPVLHMSLTLCSSISHLKNNQLNPPFSSLTPQPPLAAASCLSLSPMLPGWLPICSTRAAVDKISHLVVLRLRSAVPWCFSVISCGVSVACSSAHHPPFPLSFSCRHSPLWVFILPLGLPSQSHFLAPTLSLNL